MDSESWAVDECTTCTCDNASVTCVIDSCQPAFCAEPIKPERSCCFVCPYNVLVKKVLPEITSTDTIAEGGDNQVSVDVSIKFHDHRDTTGVSGEDLWKVFLLGLQPLQTAMDQGLDSKRIF
nr:cysteine-rich motor neuron 1 protein-like [Lytechinus pictus]